MFLERAGVLAALLLASSTAPAAESSVESVGPVIVEASKPLKSNHLQTMTNVSVGNGSKAIDAPSDDLGIELSNMERFEEVSAERRLDGWWLNPRRKEGAWSTQLKGDFSLDQKVKARTRGALWGHDFQVEGGAFLDYRSVFFMSNKGTPYDPSDDALEQYSRRKDGGYGQISVFGRTWKSIFEIDGRFEDVHAGTTLTGNRNRLKGRLSGQWSTRWGTEVLRLKPYFSLGSDRFEAKTRALFSNSAWNVLGGLQSEIELASVLLLRADASREFLERLFFDDSATQFGRYRGKVLAGVSWLTHPWIEITAHGFAEIARDEMDGTRSLLGPERQFKTQVIWDVGLDLSSSHRFAWGVSGKVRRYALMPTPSQLFGDGAILQSASDLPPETGVRASLGLWWAEKETEINVSLFAEHAQDSPVMVAVSPTTTKTTPLGGVWTRGLEAKGSFRIWRFYFIPAYSFQDSVNASAIAWQRGQAVPGRPNWNLRTELKYVHQEFKASVTHRFRSEDALDLAGLWFYPAQHQLDASIGYGKKDWEVRLLARNLLPDAGLPLNPDFTGLAGANLLEPRLEQLEVRIQCEFLM